MSDTTKCTVTIKIDDRIEWIDKRCGLSEIQKDYVKAQMQDSIIDALKQANESTKDDSSSHIADISVSAICPKCGKHKYINAMTPDEGLCTCDAF